VSWCKIHWHKNSIQIECEEIWNKHKWVVGAFSSRVKWPGHEADHSPPYNARVKNEWIYIFTCPYGVHRDILTFNLQTNRPWTDCCIVFSYISGWGVSFLSVPWEQIIVTLSDQYNSSFANTDVPLNLVTVIFTGFFTYSNLQELCATGCIVTKVVGYTGWNWSWVLGDRSW